LNVYNHFVEACSLPLVLSVLVLEFFKGHLIVFHIVLPSSNAVGCKVRWVLCKDAIAVVVEAECCSSFVFIEAQLRWERWFDLRNFRAIRRYQLPSVKRYAPRLELLEPKGPAGEIR
jgi:hypothetical protein